MKAIRQDNFLGGVLSSSAEGNLALSRRKAGASRIQNFLVNPEGSLRKRAGSRHIQEVTNSAQGSRLVSWVVSQEEQYILEFTHQRIRFYLDGRYLAGEDIATPWQGDELLSNPRDDSKPGLKFSDNENQLLVAHPNHKPRVITRNRDGSFTLSELSVNSSSRVSGLSVRPGDARDILNDRFSLLGRGWSSVTQPFPPGATSVKGIAATRNGDLLVVDETTRRFYRRSGGVWDAGVEIPGTYALGGIAENVNGDVLIAGIEVRRFFTYNGSSWDTGSPMASISVGAFLSGIDTNEEGHVFAVLGSSRDDARAIMVFKGGAWEELFRGGDVGIQSNGGISVDVDGGILILSSDDMRIKKWNGGAIVDVVNSEAMKSGTGLTVDREGNILVSDNQANVIRVFEGRAWRESTQIPSDESSPRAIAVRNDGDWMVVGSTERKIFTRSFGAWDDGVDIPDGENPRGLDVKLDGDWLLLGDRSIRTYVFEKVTVARSSNLISAEWDSGLATPPAVTDPRGVAYSIDGEILVVDKATRKYYLYFNGEWDSGTALPASITSPEDIATRDTGEVLILDDAQRKIYTRNNNGLWDDGVDITPAEATPRSFKVDDLGRLVLIGGSSRNVHIYASEGGLDSPIDRVEYGVTFIDDENSESDVSTVQINVRNPYHFARATIGSDDKLVLSRLAAANNLVSYRVSGRDGEFRVNEAEIDSDGVAKVSLYAPRPSIGDDEDAAVRFFPENAEKFWPAGGIVLSWNQHEDAVKYRIYKRRGALGALGYIGESLRGVFLDNNIEPERGDTPATTIDYLNFNPGCVKHYQGRIAFGGFEENLAAVVLSSPGSTEGVRFELTEPVIASNAIYREIARSRGGVRHIIELDEMIFLTAGEERVVHGSSEGVSPSTFNARRASGIGVSHVPPILTREFIILVGYNRNSVWMMSRVPTSGEVVGLESLEMSTLFKENLRGRRIVDAAMADNFRTAFFAFDDGTFASLLFSPEEDVYSWSEHSVSGNVKSIAVAEGAAIGESLYLIVERGGRRNIEYIRLLREDGEGREEGVYADSAIVQENVGIGATVTAAHLGGEDVVILADDTVTRRTLPGNGRFVVTNGASKVVVGLEVASILETFSVDIGAGAEDGVSYWDPKRMVRLHVETRGVPKDALLYTKGSRRIVGLPDNSQIASVESGDERMRGQRIVFEHREPRYVSILAIGARVERSDGAVAWEGSG